MKIAITGHSSGIGAAFSRYLSARGHEIIGISKRDGNNIRNIPKVVDIISTCDMWINNAQSGYAQTELLYKMAEAWNDDRSKMIWNISTMLTQDQEVPSVPGLSFTAMAEYKNQKRALEDAHQQLRTSKVSMCLIRPGAVATQPYNQSGVNAADFNGPKKTMSGS
jgi:NADP-dependent 3-hydroxy acid dehydrogenase YdfG